MKNESYIIINENDTYIGCYGHYNDFYKALGKLYRKFLDNVNCLVKDGYKVLEKKNIMS